jgi:hypothetical protein
VVASVAACVIRFGDPQSDDYEWAWDVMARVEAMKEPGDVYGGARIPWHPATRLVIALHQDQRSASPRANNAERLLKLALHRLDSVSELAFDALFADKDEHLRWVAGRLAVNLCILHRGEFKEGRWDQGPNDKAKPGRSCRRTCCAQKARKRAHAKAAVSVGQGKRGRKTKSAG